MNGIPQWTNGCESDERRGAADERTGASAGRGSSMVAPKEQPMSAAKRDNYEFRHALAAGHAPLRSLPRTAASRPDQTVPALGVQGSWNEGATRGSDPYNSCGARTRP
jgi:hypothetical protein